MAITDAEKIITPINEAAALFDHVVVVTDWHPETHVSFARNHPGAGHGDAVAVAYGEQRVFNDHCVQGSWGAELDPRLELTKAELVFRKGYRAGVDSYGAFFENDQTTRTGLADYLRARGFGRVICSGLARHGCVMQTALGAAREGFEVYILDEGAEGRRDEEASDRRLAEAGVRWLSLKDLYPAQAA